MSSGNELPDGKVGVTLAPASRRKLSETVAEQLIEAFRHLPPGTKVPSERILTKELGVGRSTVREALNGLAVLGVLEIRHGQGAFVSDPAAGSDTSRPESPLTVALERGVTREFIEARLLVEVGVARLAAERRTEDEVHIIEAALALQERTLAAKHMDDLLTIATSFNVLLAEAAHNEILAAMIQTFVELMKERGPRVYALKGFGEWDLAEHRRIFEAVRDQDGDLAADRMREHILQLAERYREAGAG
jgi:GntR family transcriptional regulator, transcriptional repressor for pyruvate dehydrogenase complex